jgi:hypothetical protein
MSHKHHRVLWGTLVIFASVGAATLIFGHPRVLFERTNKKPIWSPRLSPLTQDKSSAKPRARNLSLQPEAFNMSRRLGQRFAPAKRQQSILTGTVTIGSEQRVLQTTRKQTDAGERVEIAVVGSLGLLTWEASQGALSSGARAGASDRELIERLVLDSPDQFVLAQLRGASYFTVARNVRPANAGDGYTGPLWNIIRIGDPEPDEAKRPQSRWRLYYLNAVTGFIERIESEAQGQRIVVEMSGWTDVNGEKVPSRITWTHQGQTLMEYRLTSFAVAQM